MTPEQHEAWAEVARRMRDPEQVVLNPRSTYERDGRYCVLGHLQHVEPRDWIDTWQALRWVRLEAPHYLRDPIGAFTNGIYTAEQTADLIEEILALA